MGRWCSSPGATQVGRPPCTLTTLCMLCLAFLASAPCHAGSRHALSVQFAVPALDEQTSSWLRSHRRRHRRPAALCLPYWFPSIPPCHGGAGAAGGALHAGGLHACGRGEPVPELGPRCMGPDGLATARWVEQPVPILAGRPLEGPCHSQFTCHCALAGCSLGPCACCPTGSAGLGAGC